MLYFEVDGAGSAVVLLHSGVCDSRMWDPQWAALTERYRVVRCDFRGFGRSPATPGRYRDSEDVRAVLDAAGIDRAQVVGSSFGGLVALDLAAHAPERVVGLVLLCPAFGGWEPSEEVRAFGQQENALLEAGDLEGAVDLNVATWLGPDEEDTTRRLVASMQRRAFELQAAEPDAESEDIEVDAAFVTAPAVIVSGGRDLEHFRDVAAYLAETLPNARHQRLDWAYHLPSLERPDEVTRLLLGALSGAADRTG